MVSVQLVTNSTSPPAPLLPLAPHDQHTHHHPYINWRGGCGATHSAPDRSRSLGVRMAQNRRLLLTLTTSTAQDFETLTITLTPRTSADTKIPLLQVASEGFLLSGARIAAINRPVNLNIVGPTDTVSRGLCLVDLIETYLLPDGTEANAHSEWEVVKRQGGDPDLAGQPV